MTKTLSKENIKRRILALVLIISMIFMNISVFATNSLNQPATLTVEPSKNVVKESDTIILDVKISNITISSGISTIVLNLDVDEDIFYKLRREDIQEDKVWSTKIYNATTKQLKLSTSEKIKNNTDVVKINLKAKNEFGSPFDLTSNAPTVGNKTETRVLFKNIKVNNTRSLDDVSIKLALTNSQVPGTPGPNPGMGGESPIKEEPTKNPDAGLDREYIAIIIPLVLIAGFSIYGHRKATGKI